MAGGDDDYDSEEEDGDFDEKEIKKIKEADKSSDEEEE